MMQLRSLRTLTRSVNLEVSRAASTATRLKGFDAPTVWSEFTPLSQQHKSVNLGQGFPDWETPDFVKQALVDAIHANANQYSRSAGDLALCEALAKHYGPLVGREINPATEVTVSVGASEGIFAIMQSMLNEGDEVVTLEPTFDMYVYISNRLFLISLGLLNEFLPQLPCCRSNGWWCLSYRPFGVESQYQEVGIGFEQA